MVLYFPTKPFFAVRNLKKGSAREGSASGYNAEPLKGSVEFFILFLRLWTHLDAFRFLQNLFKEFCRPPFFSEYKPTYSKFLEIIFFPAYKLLFVFAQPSY